MAAGTVLALAALEEFTYLRHRLARQARSWWEDFEHREHYGLERSTLDALAPWILPRRSGR